MWIFSEEGCTPGPLGQAVLGCHLGARKRTASPRLFPKDEGWSVGVDVQEVIPVLKHGLWKTSFVTTPPLAPVLTANQPPKAAWPQESCPLTGYPLSAKRKLEQNLLHTYRNRRLAPWAHRGGRGVSTNTLSLQESLESPPGGLHPVLLRALTSTCHLWFL